MRKGRNSKRKEARDRVLEEFESKDLGAAIELSGSAVVLRREPSMPTSILLPPALMAKLREKASRRGIGYQTMLKIIVHEHVDEY